MNVKKIIITISIILFAAQPCFAAGDIVKLKSLSDGMADMEKASREESANYARAKNFLAGPDIKEGITKDYIKMRCGEPVVEVSEGLRWVYKPSSSTFFKGEKIYFFFDRSGKLISWQLAGQN